MRAVILVCVNALVLAACGQPALTAQPAAQAVRGQKISIRVQGVERTFLLDAPASTTSLPLALVFHGDSQTAIETETGDWSGVAAAEHLIIAFPQGVGDSWNAGDGPNPATRAGVDDVAFAKAVIQRVESSHKVDTTRVAAIGFSDGAFLTDLIGCRMAGEVHLIVPVEGQLLSSTSDSCHPAKPLSVLQVNATADPAVAYDGHFGDGGPPLLSARASIARWGVLDHCAGATSTYHNFDAQTDTTRTSCAAGTTVTLDTIAGGDHDWPPGAGVIAAAAIRHLR
jgi:polyhydroxybutyrate depolymerase